MQSKALDKHGLANSAIITDTNDKIRDAGVAGHSSRLRNILQHVNPLNWFNGFLDDLKIDLKELDG